MVHYVLQIGLIAFVWMAFVAVHEGGHVLAARLCRARYAVCQIGLLQINASGFRQWRIAAFNPFAGYVKLQQEDERSLTHTGALLFVSGGIIANVVAGLVLLGVYGLLLPYRPDNALPGGATDLNWISGLGLVSTLVGLSQLLPFHFQMGGRQFASDGWHIINILRHKP